MRRVQARVDGVVQGVGFRPYVYRLAREHELTGFVVNDERGVLLEVEGGERAVDRFLDRLTAEAPPLASIESVRARERALAGEVDFRIVASTHGRAPEALVSPDAATCDACLAELFDPADRRHRYPFMNCTDCGPRFTIVRGVPYDRPLRGDAVRAAAAALAAGRIVAIKGVGGYHLACRAGDEDAVATLRARKHREDKPFAVMAPDLAAARALVELSPDDELLLTGRARPVVIAPRHSDSPVARAVAPGSADLGVMLPYSPLHHLLLADAGVPLVMTSGNVSDEPIAHEDEDALARLAGIADLFLVHDRPIHTRTDDSVVRAVAGRRPLLLRRSRGHVPASLDLPVAASRHILASGAELKNTFCLAKGRRAWVGQHVGDLRNLETLQAFQAGIEHFERLFAVAPEVVVHDLHPDYLSTTYALAREGVETLAVQHHHAHLAACLAEHGHSGPAVGAIYDGTGHGLDGTAWGGELLVGDLGSFERAGHLWPVRLPGGDQAVREPWRMACAWLAEAGAEAGVPAGLAGGVEADRWERVARLARSGLASPATTSMGRLFDAVAALCGLRAEATYEGQAAAELEACAAPAVHGAYPLPVLTDDSLVLDARPAVVAVAHDAARGVAASIVSARFHAAVAAATAHAVSAIAERHELRTAVLGGGVFQNRRLVSQTAAELERAGLEVLVPERLPPNDGGIAYGQAAIAAWSTAERRAA